MCESCHNTPIDELIKTASFAGIRYVLYSKPIKGVVDKVESSVGIPNDATMTPSTGSKKKKHMQSLMMDSVVYLISSVAYDQYLYDMILKRIEFFKKDYAGFCPCELMRMLYLLAVQLGYDALVDGKPSIRKLLADSVAIFGAESIGNRISKMVKQRANVIA